MSNFQCLSLPKYSHNPEMRGKKKKKKILNSEADWLHVLLIILNSFWLEGWHKQGICII